MSRFKTWFAVCVCLSVCSLIHGQDAKPNVIFIMADDLGYSDLSCYGSETIETPHLDKLASTGVRCTDFHSNGAVCSPTRAALMTGRYQQRSGVRGVVTAANHRDKGLALDEWTMAEAMKELGYETALFGKWHLGYDAKFNPIHQGFDRFNGFVSGNIDYNNHIDQEGHFDWWIQNELQDEPGYLTDLITDHTLTFLSQERTKPFFLVLHHGAPHYPIQGREHPGVRVLGKPVRQQPRPKLKSPVKEVRKSMIEVMDEGIGKIVAKLEEEGLRENTLLVFCSDNGPDGSGDAGPLRGRKGSVFEGGHRVCGIFNLPGTLDKGVECDTTIATMDMLPTFVKFAGGQVAVERKLDGIDVMPILKGETVERQPIFWQHGKGWAVRHGKWKLVVYPDRESLFDLDADLAEQNNLAKTSPDQFASMMSLLDEWKTEMDQIPNLTR